MPRIASQTELKTATTTGSISASFTSLAAFSTSDDTFATSRDKSLISDGLIFSAGTGTGALLPVSTDAKEGPSGTFRLTDPDLSLPSGGIGDGSRNGANLFAVRNDFCGVCIRSAVLALIGKGIFLTYVEPINLKEP
jgi:hypothetical protein